MDFIDMIALGLIMVLGVSLSILIEKNRKLSHENSLLKEIMLKQKQEDDSIFETIPTEVHSSIPSEQDQIAALIAEGKKVDEVAQILEMPINKVEMIIKFEKIKRDHAAS